MRVLRSSGEVTRDAEGRPVRLTGVCLDITELKSAEAALQRAHDELEARVEARTAELAQRTAELAEAEQRFRAIVEASPTPLLLSRIEDGRILYANDRLEALVAAEPGSLTGQVTPDFYHDPEDRPRIIELIREQGYVRDLELRIRRNDGATRWVSLSVQQLIFDGKPTLASALIDITERKDMEEALRRSEVHFRRLTETSYDLVQLLDAEGRIVYTGPSVRRLLGYTPEEIVGGSTADFIHPDDQKRATGLIREVLSNPGRAFSLEYRVRHKDGAWRWFEAYGRTLSPTSPDDGLVANARDITERRQAQEQASRYAESLERSLHDLRVAQDRLVQQEKLASLGQLTAGIAHEIKNPLNFVNNFSELAVELTDELDEEIEANLGRPLNDVAGEFRILLGDLKLNASKIREHGQRADGIVRAMMQHARGEEGQREAVDLNALIEEYVALAYHGQRAQVADFNVEIETDLDEEVGEVEVVPQEIGRVLLNLLGNAFDAVHGQRQRADGPYTPKVSVSTRQVDNAVEIRVADNGPGIQKNLRRKIFEPFFTTKPTGSGTGLGLSLSYDIVTHGHGGTLAVKSEEGQGAAFIVTLPTPARA